MNITKAFPESDLEVYIVNDVLSADAMKTLTKLFLGHLPTGYKQDEINQAQADIVAASVKACEQAFDASGLIPVAANPKWPWFDLHVGDGRTVEENGVYEFVSTPVGFYADFCIIPSTVGGEISFKNGEHKVQLKAGQMLIGPRVENHEFTVETILEGSRFTLMTFMG